MFRQPPHRLLPLNDSHFHVSLTGMITLIAHSSSKVITKICSLKCHLPYIFIPVYAIPSDSCAIHQKSTSHSQNIAELSGVTVAPSSFQVLELPDPVRKRLDCLKPRTSNFHSVLPLWGIALVAVQRMRQEPKKSKITDLYCLRPSDKLFIMAEHRQPPHHPALPGRGFSQNDFFIHTF